MRPFICFVGFLSVGCGEPEFELCEPLRNDLDAPWGDPSGDVDGPRIESGGVTWTNAWGDGCEADFELRVAFRGDEVRDQDLENAIVWADRFDGAQPVSEPLGPLDTGGGASGQFFRKMCMRNMTSHLNQSLLLFLRDRQGRGSNVFCAGMSGTPPSGGTP